MRKKTFEIVVLNDLVSVKTDDFYCCLDDWGGGVQGINTVREQELGGKYRELAKLAREIAHSPYSYFKELSSFSKKEG